MKGFDITKVSHGGTILSAREHFRFDIIDFSASLNPFPPVVPWTPDAVDCSCYPDDGYEVLKEALARAFGRAPDEICVGNGSIELIRTFCTAVLDPGDTVRIDRPTFGEYAYSALLAGARVTETGEGAAVRFICNPNNPTGALVSRSAIRGIADDAAVRNTRIFVDEAFMELADRDESCLACRDPSLFVIRSLTKSFAVPGLRIGFGFGEPDLVERIEATRLPWTVNAFAESFTLAALPRMGELAESRTRIQEARALLETSLRELGLSISPSAANFLLVHVPADATDLARALLDRGVLVRDCTSFGLRRAIRVAVRTKDENRVLVEALATCLR